MTTENKNNLILHIALDQNDQKLTKKQRLNSIIAKSIYGFSSKKTWKLDKKNPYGTTELHLLGKTDNVIIDNISYYDWCIETNNLKKAYICTDKKEPLANYFSEYEKLDLLPDQPLDSVINLIEMAYIEQPNTCRIILRTDNMELGDYLESKYSLKFLSGFIQVLQGKPILNIYQLGKNMKYEGEKAINDFIVDPAFWNYNLIIQDDPDFGKFSISEDTNNIHCIFSSDRNVKMSGPLSIAFHVNILQAIANPDYFVDLILNFFS
jgi:hypothetical protein